MTTPRRLWLVFGLLTSLLVVSGIIVLICMHSIEENVLSQADVARPRIGLARELETGVVGYALAVNEYLREGDPEASTRASDNVAEVDQDRNEYRSLAVTAEQRELAARFDAMWSEYFALGQALLNAKHRLPETEQLARFQTLRAQLQRYLRNELQADAIAAYNARREATLGDVRNVVGFAPVLLVLGAIIAVVTSAVVGRAVIRDERIIAQQSERLRTTLASIGDAVITTDSAGRIANMNIVAEKLIGAEKDGAVGQPLEQVLTLVDEQTHEPVKELVQKALRKGNGGLSSYGVLMAKDGTSRFVDHTASPLRNDRGEVAGCVLVFRDITERRKIETRARESERAQLLLAQIAVMGSNPAGAVPATDLTKTIVEQIATDLNVSRCGFSRLDLETGQTVVEQDAYRDGLASLKGSYPIARHMTHQIADGVAGRPTVVADLATDPRTAARYAEAYEPIGVRAYISVPLHREGRWVANLWVTSQKPRHWTEGEVELMQAVADRVWLVVEQARVPAVLRESDERFRIIANSAPVLMWLNDTSGCVFVNRAYLDYLGLEEPAEVRGYDWAEFIHPEDRTAYVTKYLDCMARQAPFVAEFRFRRHNGDYRWMQSVAEPRLTSAGELLGYTGCTFDVHESRSAAAALKEANRRKDEFLSILAHELRNPLSPVRNAAYYLKLKERTDPEVRRLVEMIDRQVAQMARLIDDLLDVSRISRGMFQLVVERIDFGEVAEATVDACREEVDSRGHALHVAVPEKSVMLRADRHRLVQVFSNLIANAAKYTPAGGRIDFVAEVDGGALEVMVRDSGIGIPADRLTEIFELFAQVDRSLERQGGLGIGLTLARKLVELHRGTIEARSEGLGRGSTFVVRLPMAPAESAPADAGVADERAPAISRRILVADDNGDAAETLALILKARGHVVRVAFDGEDAIQICKEFKPEMAFIDIGMPKHNGYEVASSVRQEPWGKAIRLVALTGWGQDDDRRRAQEAGFDSHLVKPVASDTLIRLIAAIDGTSPKSGNGSGDKIAEAAKPISLDGAGTSMNS
jgi:PAS domain S-box-containing protein